MRASARSRVAYFFFRPDEFAIIRQIEAEKFRDPIDHIGHNFAQRFLLNWLGRI
jgi:hypothetical protein